MSIPRYRQMLLAEQHLYNLIEENEEKEKLNVQAEKENSNEEV
ncbi:hypothetical protein V7094_27800 [Priestia megaterium]